MGVPEAEIDARLSKANATVGALLASFEIQLKDPASPLSVTVDAYSRETFGFYIAAGKAITAWEKDSTRPLTEAELKEISPEERRGPVAVPVTFGPAAGMRGKAVLHPDGSLGPVDESTPIEFPAGLEQAKEAAKNLEDLKQAIYTTKGLSEQGIKCGMLGCENPPTVPCGLGCGNHYCEDCSKLHMHVMGDDGKPLQVQAKLPRENN